MQNLTDVRREKTKKNIQARLEKLLGARVELMVEVGEGLSKLNAVMDKLETSPWTELQPFHAPMSEILSRLEDLISALAKVDARQER